MSQNTAIEEQQRRVRMAARALGNAGLVHAYGHCSQRLNENSFLVCAAQPMGLIASGEPGTVVAVDGPLPEAVLGEVSVHQRVYARRPEVGGICRIMPPNLMALSTLGLTPKMRHGFGCHFSPEVPLWDDPQLIRTPERAIGVATTLADRQAIIMRGNGAVVVAEDLIKAVVLSWYLEDACRIELEVLKTGQKGKLIPVEQAEQRATWGGNIAERMWAYLTHGDPET